MTRRRYKKRPSQKKVRVDLVETQDDLWLNNTTEIAEFRQNVLDENGNKCEMTGETIKRPTLDHCHQTGEVRGVISQHNNTLEGYFLKYYNKYVSKHTRLTISEWLRSLADYYEVDFRRGLHFRTIHDTQVKLSRKTKQQISDLLLEDFQVVEDAEKSSKPDLIKKYMDLYIVYLEKEYQENYSEPE